MFHLESRRIGKGETEGLVSWVAVALEPPDGGVVADGDEDAAAGAEVHLANGALGAGVAQLRGPGMM